MFATVPIMGTAVFHFLIHWTTVPPLLPTNQPKRHISSKCPITKSRQEKLCILAEMCSERDSPLKRLYRRTHAKLTRLAGFRQLVWAAGCELWLALGGLRDQARHPRQYFGWPRRAKRGRPIAHEWIDPWTLLLPGQHRWAQVGATDEPREFRLARSRQDKRLERAIPLTTHLWSLHDIDSLLSMKLVHALHGWVVTP